MTNNEVYILREGIGRCGGLPGAVFSFACIDNLETTEEYIKKLEKMKESTEEFKAFQVKHQQLLEKYAKIDEEGKPVRLKNENPNIIQYDMDPERDAEFQEELAKFMEENDKLIKEQNRKEKEFQEILTKEATIKIEKIKKKDVPAEITPAQYIMIKYMIDK